MHGPPQVAIDLGTSNAVVAVRGPDGWIRPVAFNGAPVLSAAVFAAENGQILVGPEAEQQALRDPSRYEPHPKRHVDEGRVLLGDREFDVAWLIGAVLGRAYAQACQQARLRVPGVVLPYPAHWGQRRRNVLRNAAAAARLPGVRLVPEPVAAASYFVYNRSVPVPNGRCALVYDLGAATFTATVLRRTEASFQVLANDWLDDVGGRDIDAAIVAHLQEQVRKEDPAWDRLTQPGSSLDLRASRELWANAKAAKERLSRASSTVVTVPLLGVEAPLGREQFETLAKPVLERTVTMCNSVLATAKVPPGELAAVFLADGSSRIPLVSTLLHRGLGIAPVAVEDPYLAVAVGSLSVPAGWPSGPGGSVSGPPNSAHPASGPPRPASGPPHPASAPPHPASSPPRPASGPPRPMPVPMPPVPQRPQQMPQRPIRPGSVPPGPVPPRPGPAAPARPVPPNPSVPPPYRPQGW